MLCKEATDEVPVESVSSTQVDEKAVEEVPMELGMFVELFYKTLEKQFVHEWGF